MIKKVVVPISGGIDSSVLLLMAVKEYDEVHALTFDYGQRHLREIKCADLQVAYMKQSSNVTHQTLDVRFLKDLAPTSSLTNSDIDTPDVREVKGEAQPASYVPNRNMLFLSIAAARAEAVGGADIWHGATKVDSLAGYWDTDKSFMNSMNNVLILNRENVAQIKCPLLDLDKSDITHKGVELGLMFSDTYTCYSGNMLSDATTPSSSLRLQGFLESGYIDPLLYIQQDNINQSYKNRGCKLIEYENYPPTLIEKFG